jgi:hypothetical protein
MCQVAYILVGHRRIFLSCELCWLLSTLLLVAEASVAPVGEAWAFWTCLYGSKMMRPEKGQVGEVEREPCREAMKDSKARRFGRTRTCEFLKLVVRSLSLLKVCSWAANEIASGVPCT